MVDTQTFVAPKCHLPVIPPAIEFFRLGKQAEGIDQIESAKPLKHRPLSVRHQDLPLPRNGVTHISIGRCNVVVA